VVEFEDLRGITDRFGDIICGMYLKSMKENLEDRKVETPIHDSIRELVTWECKEHEVES
jgi:hypothetical protein